MISSCLTRDKMWHSVSHFVLGLLRCHIHKRTLASKQQSMRNILMVDIVSVCESNHFPGVCDLICLPVSSVGQRETRSFSEYTALSFYVVLGEQHVVSFFYLFIFAYLHSAIRCSLFFDVVQTVCGICTLVACEHPVSFVSRDFPAPTGCQADPDPRAQWWVSLIKISCHH